MGIVVDDHPHLDDVAIVDRKNRLSGTSSIGRDSVGHVDLLPTLDHMVCQAPCPVPKRRHRMAMRQPIKRRLTRRG